MDQNILKSVLYALNMISPKECNQMSDSIDIMCDDYSATYNMQGKSRLWFQYNYLSSGRHFYVSYNPPETRLEMPNDKDGVVITREQKQPSSIILRRLSKLKHILEIHEENSDEKFRHITGLIRNTLNEDYKYIEKMFWQDGVKLASNPNNNAENICWPLYEKYFLSFLLPGYIFNPAMALLRIQMRTGKWLQPSSIESSIYSLEYYLSESSKIDPNTIKFAVENANDCYTNGNISLKFALNSYSMDNFYYYLFLSFHEFFTAELLKLLLDKIPSNEIKDLKYDEIRADEGCACAFTGLWFEIDERLNDQYPNPSSIVASLLRDTRIEEVEAQLLSLCKPTNPIFPKFYVYTSLAVAKIYKDSPLLNDGITEIEQLKTEYLEKNSDTKSHEFKLIIETLLNGYTLINDDIKIKNLINEMLVLEVYSNALSHN
jgi:hypothetical protein